jgi:SAM-dependent methyltransferase
MDKQVKKSAAAAPALSLRNQRVTATLDLSGVGIEYGPLDNPILTQNHAPGIKYVDYADRDELIERYSKNPRVQPDKIPPVDIVTGGRLIDDLVEPSSLDFIVASHVAEHVPDLIGWLKSNLRALKCGGGMAVAFPDRRYTFDIARMPSQLGEIVAAHIEQRTKPPLSLIADHIINVRDVETQKAWSGETDATNAPLRRPLAKAIEGLQRIAAQDIYHDVHCWVFSDIEMQDMLRLFCQHFLPEAELLSFLPTQPGTNEFIFSLRKTAD